MSELESIRRFAEYLGWPDIQRFQHVVPSEAYEEIQGDKQVPADSTIKKDNVIVWYASGSPEQILFQINRLPPFSVAVYAVRYRIVSGWFRFELSTSRSKLRAEADRLKEWVGRKRFISTEARRTFRREHPECANFTWRRVREEAPLPYEVE